MRLVIGFLGVTGQQIYMYLSMKVSLSHYLGYFSVWLMSVAFCIGHRNYGHTKWCENLYVIYKVCDIQNMHLVVVLFRWQISKQWWNARGHLEKRKKQQRSPCIGTVMGCEVANVDEAGHRFLANVNSSSCSLYVIVRPSVVCDVGAPYSDDWNFPQCFYAIGYVGHLLTYR